MTNLTRVQITQRHRRRQQILKEELNRAGISVRRLFVADRMYDRLKAVATEYGTDVNDILDLAIRDFMKVHDGKSYDDHYFVLDDALTLAHARMVTAGLGGLRSHAPRETTS